MDFTTGREKRKIYISFKPYPRLSNLQYAIWKKKTTMQHAFALSNWIESQVLFQRTAIYKTLFFLFSIPQSTTISIPFQLEDKNTLIKLASGAGNHGTSSPFFFSKTKQSLYKNEAPQTNITV